VRSAILGFLLVFAWIVVIVALQVRGIDAPDFRPTAETILAELGKGSAAIEQVYEDPRADEPLGTAPETKPTDLPPGEPGSGSAGSAGSAEPPRPRG
jgi:hypothetical protein